jgi:ankyrin repeat protein
MPRSAYGWQGAKDKRDGVRRMRQGRYAIIAGAALALTAPLAAQDLGTGSPGEVFLKAVEEKDGGKAVPLLEEPGSRIVNYRGYKGETGLIIATRNRTADWVGFLLNKGADPNIGNHAGDTPLIIASRMGFETAVDYLIARKANVNLSNRLGETSLIVAVQQRQPRIVEKLLQAGANADKADHAAGLSARDYARRDARNPELLKLIEATKAAKKLDFTGPVIK